MEKTIIRLGYVIVGFIIGLMAGIKFARAVLDYKVLFIVAFIIAGIIIALIIESLSEPDSKKIFYLVMAFIFAIPLSWILQYLGAVVITLWKIFIQIKRIVFRF